MNPAKPAWRLVERNGDKTKEFFVNDVSIEVKSWTELVPEFGGRLQWTVACEGQLTVNNNVAIIIDDTHP